MIAQIKLDRIMKKEMFDALHGIMVLTVSQYERVAISKYSSKSLESLEIIGGGYHFQSEVTVDEDGKYRLNSDTDKVISSYDIRERPNEQYVVLTEESVVQIVDIDNLSTRHPGLQYRVEKIVPDSNFNDSMLSLINTIDELNEKMKQVSDNNFQFNTKCNVHVAGFGLMSIKEVCCEEDVEAEYLQRMLNDGWRIIACCVQPNQRRPDYILGMMDIPE